ncbi:MAG: hypothetical protein PUE71_10910 [Clostridia bacterium]|nr:hypothetical protein [Clostridia bacterium]
MRISGFDKMDNDLYGSIGAVASSQVGTLSNQEAAQAAKAGKTEEVSNAQLKSLKRSGAVKCETCASRKYQDGSNEGDVSFKAPGHIDPSASAGRVMAHEQEHVSNAVEKAAEKNAKLMSANVTLKTAICPECGKSYVAGGTTHTMIKYPKDRYGQNKKSADYQATAGANFDAAI